MPPHATFVFVVVCVWSTGAFGFLEPHFDAPPHRGDVGNLIESGLTRGEHGLASLTPLGEGLLLLAMWLPVV
jgi:hypothetical protein